jgi:hypothetical protein
MNAANVKGLISYIVSMKLTIHFIRFEGRSLIESFRVSLGVLKVLISC